MSEIKLRDGKELKVIKINAREFKSSILNNYVGQKLVGACLNRTQYYTE